MQFSIHNDPLVKCGLTVQPRHFDRWSEDTHANFSDKVSVKNVNDLESNQGYELVRQLFGSGDVQVECVMPEMETCDQWRS